MPPGNAASLAFGHIQIFRTVPPAHTLLRRVGKNAFATIVPARPGPVFGRPAHHGGGPLDYGPALLRMPFGFHLAVDTLPFGCRATAHEFRFYLGCIRRFRLRARLGVSLSAHPGQRGITPAFGYSAPYPSASGTLTHPIWALPSTHYGPLRHPKAPGLFLTDLRWVISSPRLGASRVARASLVYMPPPIPRRSVWVPSSLASPAVPAFPALTDGSAFALPFSRLAQRSLTLRPAHSPSHPR